MSRKLLEQNNFNAGELSPRLYGRSDIAQYDKGLKTATNAIVYPHGPIKRRNGSQFIAETKESGRIVKLVEFKFNSDTTFILEMGHQYIRFYTDGGRVLESGVTITSINKANPGVVQVSGSHGYSNGDVVYIAGVEGMTEVNGRFFTVANVTAGTFELSGVDTSSYTTYTSGGTSSRIYTLTGSYSESELPNVNYKQIGNTIYFTHPGVAPKKLVRTDTTDWELSTIDFLPPATDERGWLPSTTVTPAATTGSAINFTTGAAVFLASDVGRQIVNLEGAGIASITSVTSTTVAVCDIVQDFPSTSAIASQNWKLDLTPATDINPSVDALTQGAICTLTLSAAGWRSSNIGDYVRCHDGVVKITAYTSSTIVEGVVLKAMTEHGTTGTWSLEQESWTSSRGFPRSVGLIDQRLVYAGTDEFPQSVWLSEVGLYESFGVGSNDADSISVEISSNQISQIQWMATAKDLIVGTAGSELTINSGTGGALTASTIKQEPRTYYGSDLQVPITVGNEVLFIQDTSRKIRSFRYDFNIDNYTGDDLLNLSEHLTENTLVEIAYAQEPDSQVYGVLSNGDMIVGTYVRNQKVLGWTKFTTDGEYENVQSITNNGIDEIWVVVKRTINGTEKRYIELFDAGDGTNNLDAFSDSFLTLTVDTQSVSSITKANPAVVTVTGHGFSDGDSVKFTNVEGMTELNNNTYIIQNKTTNTFELKSIDSTSYGAFTSGDVGKGVTSISGLDHLEGETVQIRADGATHPDKTVSSGAVTLDLPVFDLVIGKEYTTTITTLDREYKSNLGSMQGQRSRHVKPIIKLYQSAFPLIDGEFLPNRNSVNLMNQKVPLFSGTVKYGNLSWNDKLGLTITLSDPLPLTILGIFGMIEGSV